MSYHQLCMKYIISQNIIIFIKNWYCKSGIISIPAVIFSLPLIHTFGQPKTTEHTEIGRPLCDYRSDFIISPLFIQGKPPKFALCPAAQSPQTKPPQLFTFPHFDDKIKKSKSQKMRLPCIILSSIPSPAPAGD